MNTIDKNPLAPTEEEIREHSKNSGHAHGYSEKLLSDNANNEAAKLEQIAPRVFRQSVSELEKAEQKLSEVREKAGAQAAAAGNLERQVIALGKLRENAALFASNITPALDIEAQAEETFNALWNAITNPCRQTESAYASMRENLVYYATIKPFVQARLTKVQTMEAKAVAEIQQAAKAHGIDLTALLKIMRKESGLNEETRTLGDVKVHTLFETGFLEGITE